MWLAVVVRFSYTNQEGDTMFEQAEDFIYRAVAAEGVDTERISDTGTVENLREEGYTLEDISAGRVTTSTILANIVWLW